jgi:hypothetical protein
MDSIPQSQFTIGRSLELYGNFRVWHVRGHPAMSASVVANGVESGHGVGSSIWSRLTRLGRTGGAEFLCCPSFDELQASSIQEVAFSEALRRHRLLRLGRQIRSRPPTPVSAPITCRTIRAPCRQGIAPVRQVRRRRRPSGRHRTGDGSADRRRRRSSRSASSQRFPSTAPCAEAC